MTTVKKLSEQLGVSKTTILAYCKEELHLHTEPRKALQLSANDCAAVCSRFADGNSQRAAETRETENKVGSDGVQISAQEFAELKENGNIIRTGANAGKLLVDELMHDLMEVEKRVG